MYGPIPIGLLDSQIKYWISRTFPPKQKEEKFNLKVAVGLGLVGVGLSGCTLSPPPIAAPLPEGYVAPPFLTPEPSATPTPFVLPTTTPEPSETPKPSVISTPTVRPTIAATPTPKDTPTPIDLSSAAEQIVGINETAPQTTFYPIVDADGKIIRDGVFINAWWVGTDGKPHKGFVPPPISFNPDAKPAPFVWTDKTLAADAQTIDSLAVLQPHDEYLTNPDFFAYSNFKTGEQTNPKYPKSAGRPEQAAGVFKYAYINQNGQFVLGINTKFGSDKLSKPDLREFVLDPKSGSSTILVGRSNDSATRIGPTNEFGFVFLLTYKNLYQKHIYVQVLTAGSPDYVILY
jgi:hypothetical protein